MDQPVPERVMSSAAPSADARVVTELHEQHGARLFDFARHQGLSDTQAADVLQEALLRLWRELRHGTPIQNPVAWAFRTTYRLAMEQHRWRRALARVLPRLAPVHPTYAGPEASDAVAVWSMVDGLPQRQRQVLYLHYASDLQFEEVAAVIGISPSAARTHASRGLATLRTQLATTEEPL
jgi:RNA polymerase sigma-70 factor (ECF subfamily)